MLIEAIVLSIIAGLIFKGRFSNLKTLEIRQAWLFFGGLIIRYIPRLLDLPAPVFFILSYAMLTAGALCNLKYIEMYIILGGILCNFAVVAANGGYMPVSREILSASGYPLNELTDGLIDMNHKLSGSDTKLYFLADIIPLTKFYPVKKIISIGDILMSIGSFVFLFRRLRGKSDQSRVIK